MDAAAHVETKAKAAKEASRVLALASTRVKNEALGQMARGLEERTRAILDANRHDLERARTAGHARAFVERLTLTEGRVEEMAAGLRQVASLPDPVGETVETIRRPSGLEIVRVESNTLLAQILGKAVEKAGLPPEVIQAVETADRAGVMAMLTLDRDLDLIIPRGGEEFVRLVAERATVPVLKHDKGLCHLYVDDGADLDMALAVAVNAKAQRVSVCNSLETLLVHAAIAPALLPRLAARLAEVPVEVRADERARALMPGARAAEPADWDAEYLDYILAVRVVEDLEEAVAHIRRHGSGLAESIVTRDVRRARRFTQEVDAAAVLVNASTRLVDGSQFGMGAEMGISTSRVHARGPVGVRELTTTKFVVWGDGHIRE